MAVRSMWLLLAAALGLSVVVFTLFGYSGHEASAQADKTGQIGKADNARNSGGAGDASKAGGGRQPPVPVTVARVVQQAVPVRIQTVGSAIFTVDACCTRA